MTVRTQILRGALALAAAAAVAGPAASAILTVRSSGIIDGPAIDRLGLFGAPGASLAGLSVRTQTTIDTTGLAVATGSDPDSSRMAGGRFLHRPAIGPTTITVNGLSQVIAGEYIGQYALVRENGDPEGRDVLLAAEDRVDPASAALYDADFGIQIVQLPGSLPPGALDLGAGTYNAFGLVGQPIGSNLPLDLFDLAPGNYCQLALLCTGVFDFNRVFVGPGSDTTATIALSAVTISSGAPEPGAWTLMLLGFGALGAALRRARRAVVVA